MGGIDQLAIVQLGGEAAREGLVLSTEAHWNQNEADWGFFLTQGTVLGVRDGDGRLIATAALLPYADGNAWISMVLVTASWRRRGLATKLVDACLERAASEGLTPWLDATPAGATVYGPLGFRPVLELRRLRFAGSAPSPSPQNVSNAGIDELIARDRRAMGFDRSALLREFSARQGSRVIAHDNAIALIRDGRTARQIGPLYADGTASAVAMVDALVASQSGPMLIDVVNSHGEFLDALTRCAWRVERPFQRMRFSPAAPASATSPFAVAGPEFG
ncbi:MAG TPA: GNAT family N-acetyltransferase [Bradyrhizobium sp.]|nr:GNAT family N-acetyltransferase [Bradyrhizobium sp.]